MSDSLPAVAAARQSGAAPARLAVDPAALAQLAGQLHDRAAALRSGAPALSSAWQQAAAALAAAAHRRSARGDVAGLRVGARGVRRLGGSNRPGLAPRRRDLCGCRWPGPHLAAWRRSAWSIRWPAPRCWLVSTPVPSPLWSPAWARRASRCVRSAPGSRGCRALSAAGRGPVTTLSSARLTWSVFGSARPETRLGVAAAALSALAVVLESLQQEVSAAQRVLRAAGPTDPVHAMAAQLD